MRRTAKQNERRESHGNPRITDLGFPLPGERINGHRYGEISYGDEPVGANIQPEGIGLPEKTVPVRHEILGRK
jgi:hypothetical protein